MINHKMRIFTEQVINLDQNYTHPPYALEHELYKAITFGDLAKSRELLSKINQMKKARLAGSKLRSLKNSLIASVTIFTRAAIKGGVNAEEAFNLSDSYIREIEKYDDENRLENFELVMLEDFVDLVTAHKNERKNILVWRAIKYINSNLTHSISLKDTAAHLKISEQHLSTEFSNNMGLSFIEYVHKVKIENAKNSLLSSNLSIESIATYFGFSRQSYFAKIFKKLTGLSPLDYRRKNSQI